MKKIILIALTVVAIACSKNQEYSCVCQATYNNPLQWTNPNTHPTTTIHQNKEDAEYACRNDGKNDGTVTYSCTVDEWE